MKEFVLVIYAINYQCLLSFLSSFDRAHEKFISKNCTTKMTPLTTRFYFFSYIYIYIMYYLYYLLFFGSLILGKTFDSS
jgi:hypothetical protein